MEPMTVASTRREPWNKGKLVGQKSPLKLKEIWAGRIASRNFLTLCLTEILTIWMLFRRFDLVHLGICPD